MFKVSRRVDYGLRLLIALASEPDASPQATAVLAERLDIPLAFLHQIGRSLIQAGYLKASPGPGGGLRLNRSPKSITLRNVLEVLEGPICLVGHSEEEEVESAEPDCPTTEIWGEIQEYLVNHLDRIDLHGLTNGTAKGMEGLLKLSDYSKRSDSLAA